MSVAGLIRQTLYPARKGAVSFRRRNLARNACVFIVKNAMGYRALLKGLEVVQPLDRPDIRFVAADSMVLDTVFWTGVQGYEGILCELWAKLSGAAASVLEIGGNIGFYSVLGGKAARGKYIVMEPMPHIAQLLRKNLLLNDLAGVEVIEAAAIADATPREVIFNLPDEARELQTGAHIVDGVEIQGRQTLRRLAVKGIPFSTLIQGCDLIKIDAEGLEFALLKSGERTILDHKPTLVIEVLPESSKLALLLRQLAATARYRIFVPPAYGSDAVVEVAPEDFSASVPRAFNSKDVILSTKDVSRIL